MNVSLAVFAIEQDFVAVCLVRALRGVTNGRVILTQRLYPRQRHESFLMGDGPRNVFYMYAKSAPHEWVRRAHFTRLGWLFKGSQGYRETSAQI